MEPGLLKKLPPADLLVVRFVIGEEWDAWAERHSQLELFISGSLKQLIPDDLYRYALIVFSIFRGCGMKSLTAIVSTTVDPAPIRKRRFVRCSLACEWGCS